MGLWTFFSFFFFPKNKFVIAAMLPEYKTCFPRNKSTPSRAGGASVSPVLGVAPSACQTLINARGLNELNLWR